MKKKQKQKFKEQKQKTSPPSLKEGKAPLKKPTKKNITNKPAGVNHSAPLLFYQIIQKPKGRDALDIWIKEVLIQWVNLYKSLDFEPTEAYDDGFSYIVIWRGYGKVTEEDVKVVNTFLRHRFNHSLGSCFTGNLEHLFSPKYKQQLKPIKETSRFYTQEEINRFFEFLRNEVAQLPIETTPRKEFLEVINAFDYSSNEDGLTGYVFFSKETKELRIFNDDLVEDNSYTHISFAPIKVAIADGLNRKTLAYAPFKAIWTKICLALDLDFQDETKKEEGLKQVFEFFQAIHLPPSLIIETNKGYHLVWLLKDKYEISDHNRDNWFAYNELLDHLRYILREQFSFIDKVLHRHYVRLPIEGKRFEDSGFRYDFVTFEAILRETFKTDIERLENLKGKSTGSAQQDVTFDYILEGFEGCHHIQKLDKTTAEHNYPKYFVWTRAYANLYHKASEKDKPIIREQFHKLSSLHPKYDEKENDYFFDYLAREFIPMKCYYIITNCYDTIEEQKEAIEECKQNCKLYRNINEHTLQRLSPFLYRPKKENEKENEEGEDVEIGLADEIAKSFFMSLSGKSIFYEYNVEIRVKGDYFVGTFYVKPKEKKNNDVGNGDIDYIYVGEKKLFPYIRIERIFSYKQPAGKAEIQIAIKTKDLYGNIVETVIPEPVAKENYMEILKQLIAINYIPSKKAIVEFEEYMEGMGLVFITIDFVDHLETILVELLSLYRVKHGYKKDELNTKNVCLTTFLGHDMVYDPFQLDFQPIPEEIWRELYNLKIAPPVIYDRAGDVNLYFTELSKLASKDPFLKYIVGALASPIHHRPFHDLPTLPGNPIVLLLGRAGAGKTKRIETLMSLWARGINNPTQRLYPLSGSAYMTEAFLSYVLPFCQIPVAFDDVQKVETPTKNIDLSALIKTLFNIVDSPARYNASQLYQGKRMRSAFFFTIEPKHFKTLIADFEELTGTARRVVTIKIPDITTQSQIIDPNYKPSDKQTEYQPFELLMKEYERFKHMTREHYGFINEYYNWFKASFDSEVYKKIHNEIEPYMKEPTQKTILSLLLLHAYYFSKFLYERYNANIEIIKEEERTHISQATAEDFVEEFQYITQRKWEDNLRGEIDELFKFLEENAKEVFSPEQKKEFEARPIKPSSLELPAGSLQDKRLWQILIGDIVYRGEKVDVTFHASNPLLSLFIYKRRENYDNNAYQEAYNTMEERNFPALWEHSYYKKLKQYLIARLHKKLDHAKVSDKEMHDLLKGLIYCMLIHLLRNYALHNLTPFIDILPAELRNRIEKVYSLFFHPSQGKLLFTAKDEAVKNVEQTLEKTEKKLYGMTITHNQEQNGHREGEEENHRILLEEIVDPDTGLIF